MMPKQLLPAAGLVALLVAAPASRRDPPPNSLVGITVPSQFAVIGPEQAGKLTLLAVHEGDRVEAGDVLFQLNSTLEQLEVDRLQALAESDLFERRAAATLAHAERQTDRVREMHDKDITSERDLQNEMHELELARLKLEQAQLDKAQAINSLAQARERLAQRTVRSPFAGMVTDHMKSPGEAVEKFVPVVELMSIDPLWIEFECPLVQQSLYQKGGMVRVSPTENPSDTRTAMILLTSIKSTASSHSFMVRAAVDNDDLRWKTGQKMMIEPSDAQATPAGGK